MKTVLDRFMDKVAKIPTSDGCWVWIAARCTDGYGNFYLNGKLVGAHRAAYELFVGEIPDGKFVLHECDNSWCVAPGHLFLGTAQSNMDDMRTKGRQRYLNGEDTGSSLLTETQVTEIRSIYSSGEHSQRQVAEMFGICQATVWQIVNQVTWRNSNVGL